MMQRNGSSPGEKAVQTVARNKGRTEKKREAHAPRHETRVEQAEARTEQAEARTEQAVGRTEQAVGRTEQAVGRTEQAEARTEQAEARAERAEARTEQIEARSEQAETRSEQAIRASELSYRRLFETAKDGILILDAETGRISDVNPFLVELLGFPHSEIVDKTVGELSPFKDIESNKAMLERLQEQGYVRYEDLPLETTDNRRIAVEFVSNVYQVGDKKVIQCNIRDITERKRAQDQIRKLNAELEQRVIDRTAQLQAANRVLRESEERFRLLVEGVQDYAIFMLSPQGHVISWNKGAERIKGYKVDEIIGKHFSCFYTPEAIVQGKPEEELRTAIEQGHTGEEGWRVRKDGQQFWASVVITAIFDKGGCLQGFAKITRDMTEAKRSEQAIYDKNLKLEKNARDLARSNSDLEAFSYSVSHDLHAPLRHIVGFVELLQKGAGPSLSEKNLRHLTTISKSAKRMGDLIDDLLAFSRIGQSEMQKTEVNLDELVRETLGDFQAETTGREIVWTINALPVVRVDRALLRLVTVNLVSNALKFTGGRNKAKIEIGCGPDVANEKVIFIRDNGAGFDPRYSEKLFGVFQRLHSQEEFEGTGIGLANVQRIIKRHGGRTWAEGVVDGGATFYFSIPS
jgi:PAS domain S-box-containing protein